MKVIKKASLYFLGLTAIFISLAIVYFHLAYLHKIYPGIEIAKIPVGNQTKANAQENLKQFIENKINEKKSIMIKSNSHQVEIELDQLKLQYDLAQKTAQAYQIGRNGDLLTNMRRKFQAWQGINLPLEYTFSQDYLNEKISHLADEVNKPAIEPSIEIASDNSHSKIIVHPGEPGQRLNLRSLRTTLNRNLSWINFFDLEIKPLETSPALTKKEAQTIAQEAEKYLGKKLTLKHENKTWTLLEKELINFLSFNQGLDYFKISQYTDQLADSVNQPPENAAFQFENGKVTEFRPAKTGKSLKKDDTVNLISQGLQELKTKPAIEISLPIEHIGPAVTTDNANELGIRELVGKGESWFKGSITSRIHNIKTAANKLNGELIAPGETFSFNQEIGEISEATGYQKAYIIKNGRTILGDGGGVCQVSTTLFRAVLNTGLPMLERKAHAYRVYYYEQNSPVGQDATVYNPTADLKFKNDTPGYLLIQNKVNEVKKKLTFELYGTSDGRKVEISKTRIWDQVAPPPALYQDDPSLPQGITKQIDWPSWGAKAAFDWKVTRDGDILHEQTFYSNYRPWQAVYLVGTKPN